MADYDYVSSTGVVIPDTADLMADVVAEYQTALGIDIITTPDTPEGMLIAAEVSARSAVVRNNVDLANQINPNIAGGIFLDALWALTGGQRTVATRSTATCTVTGVLGTIVSTSVRFRSSAGDLWAVLNSVTIPIGLSISVDVRAVEYGPIAAPIAAINQIAIGVLGLETVTNSVAAELGTLTQSDQSVRALRKKTLAIQGVSLPVSIISALYSVDNVKSLIFRENYTNASIVIDGVTLLPHSIYVCIDGGSDEDIAFALLRKSLGANFNGIETVAVQDPSSGQVYNVQFSRPVLVPVLIRVTARVANPLIDLQTSVITAIMSYVNGGVEGEDGLVVGGSVSPFELASAINIRYPNIYVQKVEIALVSDGVYSTNEIPILISELATTTESSITVISV